MCLIDIVAHCNVKVWLESIKWSVVHSFSFDHDWEIVEWEKVEFSKKSSKSSPNIQKIKSIDRSKKIVDVHYKLKK